MGAFLTSHSAAKKAGAQFYFTARPCKRGHITRRFTTNGTCVDCGVVQVRESYRANREAIQKRRNASRAANPDPTRAAARARYWADHAAGTAANQRKRAKRAGVDSTLTADDIRSIIAEQNGLCAHCKQIVKLTVDHIIPLSKLGPNIRTNVQMLCLPCNSQKGSS